jgi:hypothetical protein
MTSQVEAEFDVSKYRMAYEPAPIIVYLIDCLINDKSYVGITNTTIARRVNGHEASRNYGREGSLAAAIAEHGIESFRWYELARFSASQKKEAARAEQLWIAKYETQLPHKGFNLNRGGRLVMAGAGECYQAGGLIFFGIQQMADFTGRSPGTIRHRLKQSMWTPDEACGFEPRPSRSTIRERLRIQAHMLRSEEVHRRLARTGPRLRPPAKYVE